MQLPHSVDQVAIDSVVAAQLQNTSRTTLDAAQGQLDDQPLGELLAFLRSPGEATAHLHRTLLQAREAERTRIAYDLHDDVVPSLLRLKYRVERLIADQVVASEAGSALLDDVLSVTRLMRHVCAGLRPPPLDTLGLVGAVRALVDTTQRTAALQIKLLIEGNEAMLVPDEIGVCLYRMVQEALHNVVKHAAAQQVHVHVALQPGSVSVAVVDDGRGFRMPSRRELIQEYHFGLAGLQERVALLNGSFTVVSTPRHGTCLRARVPFTVATPWGSKKEMHDDSATTSIEIHSSDAKHSRRCG